MRNKACKPDVVIFATGYRPSFPFLDATYPRLKDANAWDIWVPGDPSVAFIGFKRPNIGKSMVFGFLNRAILSHS
jgi:dimethylaniline monooxygenase (N-oxide forming)